MATKRLFYTHTVRYISIAMTINDLHTADSQERVIKPTTRERQQFTEMEVAL